MLRLRSWMNDFIDKFVNWMLIKITVLLTITSDLQAVMNFAEIKIHWLILRNTVPGDWTGYLQEHNKSLWILTVDTRHLTPLCSSHRTSDSEKTDPLIVSPLIQRLFQLVLTFEWFKLKVLMRFRVSCWIFSPEIFVSDVSQLTSV